MNFVSELVSNGKVTKMSLSLVQAIQAHVTNIPNQTTVGLALKCLLYFGSKELNNIAHHEYSIATTYYVKDEALRFKLSAAKYMDDQNYNTCLV